MKTKTIPVFCAAVAVCVLAFLMPDIVLTLHDRTVSSRVESVEADEVSLTLMADLSATQRLLLAGDLYATVIPLAAGRNMDAEEAQGMSAKVARGFLPDALAVDASAELRVGSDGSAIIVWRTMCTGNGWNLTLLLDDSDGAILGIALWVTEGANPWAGEVPLEPDTAMFFVEGFAETILDQFGLYLAYAEEHETGSLLLHISDGTEIPVSVLVDNGMYVSVNI